ncbi:MAG: YfhO family protein [Pseudomonadota bacterium]
MSPTLRRWCLLLGFLAFPILVFFPYLTGWRLLGGNDFEQIYLPWQRFILNELKLGHFPLWNPYLLLGKSVLAEPENSLFYPPRWILLFRPEYSISIYLALHFAWAHFGGFRAGRALGLERLPAWLCGFVFAFNGWMCSHLWTNHVFILAAVSWIPHLLATLLTFSEERDWRIWTAVLFLEGTMLSQAGAPQTAYYSAVFLALAALALRPRLFGKRAFVCGLLVAAAAAVLVALPQGIATAISQHESIRSGAFPWERAIWFRLFPHQLKEFLFGPSLDFIARNDATVFESGVFVGPIVVLLALAALLRREARVLGLWGLVLLFLALGMAEPTWLLKAFRLLPGAASFRSPGRFLINCILPLGLLAGLGWQLISERFVKRLRSNVRYGIAAVGSAALVLPLALFFPFYVPEASRRFDRLRGELAEAARNLSGEERPRVMLGDGPLLANAFVQEGIEMVNGRGSPFFSWRYLNYLSGPEEFGDSIETVHAMWPSPHSYVSLLGAPLFFSTGREKPVSGIERVGRVAPYNIYFDPSAVPRVRFYPLGTAVKDRLGARSLLLSGRNAYRDLWYEGPQLEGLSAEARGACTYSLPSTDEYEIRCRTTGPGFVWVSQAYDSGWTAQVNGARAPVFPAHLLFAAVPIPAGESRIHLKYHPKYLWPSLFLAALGLMIPLSLVILGPRKKMPAPERGE